MAGRVLPWVLLAIVVGGGLWWADRANDRLRELREHETVLTDSIANQSRLIAESEREIARSDSLAAASVARAQLEADEAVRDAQGAASRLRGILGENEAALAELDTIEAAHATERAAWERRDVLRLAQIRSRDDLIQRQREQIDIQAALVVNLRGQVSALDPPFFVGLFRDLPKLAAAAAVGAVLVQ